MLDNPNLKACVNDMQSAPKDGSIIRATNRIMRENGDTMLVQWGAYEMTMSGMKHSGEGWLLVSHEGKEWIAEGIGLPVRPSQWSPLGEYETYWEATCPECETGYFSDDKVTGKHPCPNCVAFEREDPGMLSYSETPYPPENDSIGNVPA